MHEFYENPLCGRYADEEMKRLFSDDTKFSTWRRSWACPSARSSWTRCAPT